MALKTYAGAFYAETGQQHNRHPAGSKIKQS